MNARFRRFLEALGDAFYILPGLCVLGGIAAAVGLVALDRSGRVPDWVVDSPFVYSGGATGARTLLGAVASSTIGVAGTIFSITIAALTLAAGQMGPRLLRNFTRDRGNQVTLGVFLGTFSYALMVLRTVRTPGEGDFVPHVALSAGMVLAFCCVGTLVFFVHHVAGRINVDTVIHLVSRDVHAALHRLAVSGPPPAPPPDSVWRDAVPVAGTRDGYFQELDQGGLAAWAAERGTVVRLLARPGDYVFPGAPLALLTRPADGAREAIEDATVIGAQRVSSIDLEYSVRQLVEVGVRALSPGINDPHTAMSVAEHLGAVLCALAPLHLPGGAVLHEGALGLVVPRIDYDGLVDAMFNMLRQNGSASPAVMIRLVEVLTAVASCETRSDRLAALQRHADLLLADGERAIASPADVEDLRARHRRLATLRGRGIAAVVAGT